MRKFTILATLLLGVLVMSSSCSLHKIDAYQAEQPKMDFKEYFNGPIKAWGIVQDWKGQVTRRFDINMVGSWDGDVGKLEEDFAYYDGETQRRVWNIRKLSDNRFEGTAADILGKAEGKMVGNAAQWGYVMDLPVGDTTYRVTFDDWMWLMNDGVLMNRSYIKKFGFTVAELTIFMQKQPVKNGE